MQTSRTHATGKSARPTDEGANILTMLRWAPPYALWLLGVGVLLIVAHVTLERTVGHQQTVQSGINVAGKQRALAQRILSLATALGAARTTAESDRVGALLEGAMDEFEGAHERIVQGDAGLGLGGALTGELQQYYMQPPVFLDRGVREFLADARAMASANDEQRVIANPALRRMWETTEASLAESLDGAVKLFEEAARSEASVLVGMGRLALVGMLGMLAFLGIAIFRPLANHARAALERAQALRAALYDAEARRQALYDSSRDAILTLAPDGAIADANRTACMLLGYDRTDLVGKPMQVAFPSFDAVLSKTPRLYGARRSDGRGFEAELLLRQVEEGSDRVTHAFVRPHVVASHASSSVSSSASAAHV